MKIKICSQFLILLISFGITARAEAPPPPIELDLVIEIKYERDIETEINQWLDALSICESNGNEIAINPRDLDGTASLGLYQFKRATWKYYLEKYGLSPLTSEGIEDLEESIWNGKLQRTVVRRMVDDPKVRWESEFPQCVKRLGLPPR